MSQGPRAQFWLLASSLTTLFSFQVSSILTAFCAFHVIMGSFFPWTPNSHISNPYPASPLRSQTWHFKSHMPKAELLTFPHKIAPPAIFPNKVHGLPVFPAAEIKNLEPVISLSQRTSELSTNPDSPAFSIYIRNLPLFTMSFAVTLVQATTIPCLHSCSSLLTLPASLITVAGVILLIGRVRACHSGSKLPVASFLIQRKANVFTITYTSLCLLASLCYFLLFFLPLTLL